MSTPPTLKKKSGVPKTLPIAALNLMAARFKMLAEPMRLRLLNELRGGEKTVSELVGATEAGQANVSKHLGLLADAGMVSRRKDGPNAYYFISDESLFEICDLVCGRLQKELAEKAACFNG